MHIILASASPRRRELLEQIGITDYEIIVSQVDERISESLPPWEQVEQLAQRKAAAVANIAPSGMILAADTLVVFQNNILGKPKSTQEAFTMLEMLSNQWHEVYTGVSLWYNKESISFHQITQVNFRNLTAQEISDYIATGEPMDKAGSYGIQGRGARFIQGIQGDYFNVMGLPLCKLEQEFTRWTGQPLVSNESL